MQKGQQETILSVSHMLCSHIGQDNKFHRHLAYEIRNQPNTKQSRETDAYSVGYMLKHAAAVIPYSPIYELGRMLKHENVLMRISIKNCLEKLSKL